MTVTIKLDRRSFLAHALGAAVIASIPLAATPPPPIPVISDSQALHDLNSMAGVQTVDGRACLVFLMHTCVVPNGKGGWKYDPTHPTITIDKHTAWLDASMSLPEWRIAAAKKLLANAKEDLIPPAHLNALRTKHEVIRRGGNVSKTCRRGRATVIIGCEAGIKALQLPDHQQWYRVVTFKTGEISDKPFALIGYNGWTKYDTALALAHHPSGFGTLFEHPNGIGQYWRRMI